MCWDSFQKLSSWEGQNSSWALCWLATAETVPRNSYPRRIRCWHCLQTLATQLLSLRTRASRLWRTVHIDVSSSQELSSTLTSIPAFHCHFDKLRLTNLDFSSSHPEATQTAQPLKVFVFQQEQKIWYSQANWKNFKTDAPVFLQVHQDNRHQSHPQVEKNYRQVVLFFHFQFKCSTVAMQTTLTIKLSVVFQVISDGRASFGCVCQLQAWLPPRAFLL